MVAFNILCGLVTIASLLFSFYLFLKSKAKKEIETEKINSYKNQLKTLVTLSKSISKQAALIAAVADKDETTKKELKHLCISQLSTIYAIYDLSKHNLDNISRWSFGVPLDYFRIKSIEDQDAENGNTNGTSL